VRSIWLSQQRERETSGNLNSKTCININCQEQGFQFILTQPKRKNRAKRVRENAEGNGKDLAEWSETTNKRPQANKKRRQTKLMREIQAQSTKFLIRSSVRPYFLVSDFTEFQGVRFIMLTSSVSSHRTTKCLQVQYIAPPL
jgi:hypothetical protein